MPNIVVQTREDSPHYANVSVTADGYVRVQLCRRVLWSGTPVGPGLAASHPPRPVQRLIHCTLYDAPLHVVLDRIYDDVLARLDR